MNKLNDKQEKEAFFAQYLYQNVLSFEFGRRTLIEPCTPTRIERHYWQEDSHLLLTNINDITDEHAIEVAKIMYPKDKHNDKDSLEWGKEIASEIIKGQTDKDVIWFAGILPVIDYLRSQGYLLPFRGYTTQQLLDIGWVKLRTNN